ncbi:3',5'-cyclic adenosine monophosphate phosphodiesterase CpdA [Psychromonas marina]|uniref:3',5'-cyclic adenosine monophosphate phosphodiesterase CpdA n=1 Tax=Psychromonas marina TaxID=88364 RepID=A0ABQ6E1E2_9GAMM|nr:3',5'-cyclic-AMP phosphodiesterase [Psychromonas marina]GLS90841.1 3',5'-cyclic adenosine monophosphate phosphodiesterase CpdA [Psychromonas marina]
MKSKVVQLKADPQGDLAFLQITDTHLFADRQKDLLGIKTVQSFEAVVEHASKYKHCHAVLSTGDLSQDHSAQSYLDFCQHIKTLNLPCYWLPGNHDIQAVMLPNLLAEGLAHTQVIESENWQIILLDSQVEGVPHGLLSDTQFAVLEKTLKKNPNKHTLICVHHHILPVGSAWLDQHIMKNNHQFLDLIAPFSNVVAVLSGHVHQASDTLQDGVRFITTPSTCVQFKPNSNDFALDSVAPGYRYLKLKASGEIETVVERIDKDAFSVDADATGY